MRVVNSLDELVIPKKHREFLESFLRNVPKIDNRRKIDKIILFGSCARGDATEESDIDLAALGEDIDDETLWELYDCAPDYVPGKYVENDIIVITNELFNKYADSFGMVQKYIAKEGVDLSELL